MQNFAKRGIPANKNPAVVVDKVTLSGNKVSQNNLQDLASSYDLHHLNYDQALSLGRELVKRGVFDEGDVFELCLYTQNPSIDEGDSPSASTIDRVRTVDMLGDYEQRVAFGPQPGEKGFERTVAVRDVQRSLDALRNNRNA